MNGKELNKRNRQQSFLELYIDNPNITACCKDVGINQSTFHRWGNDKWFQKELEKIFDTRKVLAKSAIVEILKDTKHPDRFKAAKMVLSKDADWGDQENTKLSGSIGMKVEVEFYDSPMDAPDILI